MLFVNKNIMELGCGIGIPSIVCSKFCGANQIIFTDKNMNLLKPLILQCAELNEINFKQIPIFENLNWGNYDISVVTKYAKNTDFLIASDCLYDEREFDNFFSILRTIKEANSSIKILTVYEDRGAYDCLLTYAECYGFKMNDEQNSRFWERLDSYGTGENFNRNCYLFYIN